MTAFPALDGNDYVKITRRDENGVGVSEAVPLSDIQQTGWGNYQDNTYTETLLPLLMYTIFDTL